MLWQTRGFTSLFDVFPYSQQYNECVMNHLPPIYLKVFFVSPVPSYLSLWLSLIN